MKFSFKLEEVKYIKIVYKNFQGHSCSIQAGLKDIGEEEITACARYNDALEINLPQEITLNIICNDGLYRTKTTLLSVSSEEPYLFFNIKVPDGMEYQQNREYFRVLAGFDCTYTYEETEEEIKEYKAKTYDISANGVSIITPELFIPKVDGQIILNINGCEICANAHFVRSEEIPDGYKISFVYTGISNLDRDFISQVCIKTQLEEKQKRYI